MMTEMHISNRIDRETYELSWRFLWRRDCDTEEEADIRFD